MFPNAGSFGNWHAVTSAEAQLRLRWHELYFSRKAWRWLGAIGREKAITIADFPLDVMKGTGLQ
jgi:hypothetical protein